MPIELRNQTAADDGDDAQDTEEEVPAFSVVPGGRGTSPTGDDESDTGQSKPKLSRGTSL